MNRDLGKPPEFPDFKKFEGKMEMVQRFAPILDDKNPEHVAAMKVLARQVVPDLREAASGLCAMAEWLADAADEIEKLAEGKD